MLDHGLEIVAYALKLRQSHLLPIGASPEDQAAQKATINLCASLCTLFDPCSEKNVDLGVQVR